MKTIRLKHGIVLVSKNDKGLKLEWGRLGWFGFAFRRDIRGFTLNLFLYWNFHVSFAFLAARDDVEVKTYGGFIMPREQLAVWQWAWTGGGSEINAPGTFKEFPYGDFILGRKQFAERTVGNFQRKLEMPEGVYGLEIQLDEGSWKRPRSPFTKRMFRARIQVADDREIPVPLDDKGAESGTYGETRNALKTSNIDKIVADYKHDLMEERRWVGGSYDWQPKEKAS